MPKQGTKRRRGVENADCDDRITPPTPLRGHPPSLVVPPRYSLSDQELLKHMLNEDSSFRLLESKGRNCTVHLIRTPDGQSHTCSMHSLAIDLLRKAQGCTHLSKATTYSYAASLVMSAWNRIIKPSLFTVSGNNFDEHTVNLWHDLHEHPKAAYFEKMIIKQLGANGGGCLHKIKIRLADPCDMCNKILKKDPQTTIRDTREFLSDCEHWLASIDQPSLYGNIEEARIQLVLLAAKLLPTLRSTITELSSLHGAHSKDKDVLVVETKLLGIRVLSKIGQHEVAQKEINALAKYYGNNLLFATKIMLVNARVILSTVGTIDSIRLVGSSNANDLFHLAQKKLHEILVAEESYIRLCFGEDTEKKTIIWIEAKRMKTTVEKFLATSRIDGFFEVLRKLVGVSVGLSGDHHFCVEHQAKEEFCRRGNLALMDSFALMVFVLNDFGLNYTSNIEHRESKFTKETLQKLKLATLEDGFVDALKAFPFSHPGTATRIFLAERLVPGKLALLYNALIGRRWLADEMQSCTSIFGTHFDSFFSGEDRNEQSKIEYRFVRTAKDIQGKGDEWTKRKVGEFLKLFHEQCTTRKALKSVLQNSFDIENDEVKFDLYDCALKLAKKVPYPSILDDLEDDLEEDEHGLLASIGFLRAKHQHLSGASREEVLEWFGDTYGHTCWEVAAKVEFHMMALKRLEENGAFKDAIAGYDEDLGEGLIDSENAQKIQEAKWQCVNRCFKHFLVKEASKKSHRGLSEGTLWNIPSVLGLDPMETKVVECMRQSLHQVFGNANASTTKCHGISLAAYFHREATHFQMLLKEIQIEIDNSCIEPEDSISLKLLQEATKKKLSQLGELNKPYQASPPQPINY